MDDSGQQDAPLDVLSRSQGLSILSYLDEHQRAQYSEIQDDLELNSSVVNRRLKELKAINFVRKRHGIYEITPAGSRAVLLVEHLNELANSSQ